MIEVNQVGQFSGMKAVLEAVGRTGRDSIINIASVGGLVGEPHTFAYTASKFAVTGIAKADAQEFGPRGIGVNSVHPRVIGTEALTSTA